MKMHRGMMTVEVLVALLILFLTVSMTLSGVKFLTGVEQRKEGYQERYMTVLSLKERLMHLCAVQGSDSGRFDGYDYRASCTKVTEMRNFRVALDTEDVAGNFGRYSMQLYRMELSLSDGSGEQRYGYYVTESRAVQ